MIPTNKTSFDSTCGSSYRPPPPPASYPDFSLSEISTPRSLPSPPSAIHPATKFTLAINSCDIQELQQFFVTNCSPHVMVSHRIHIPNQALSESDHTVPFFNPFGNFQHLNFPNCHVFFSFMENLFVMMPDAAMKIAALESSFQEGHAHRLFNCAFEWTGTVITTSSELVHVDHSTQQMYLINKKADITMFAQGPKPKIKLQGFQSHYVNLVTNKVDKLELYYKFC